ncbi:MAG: DUF1569 domain-containing protein [Planctomycetota bacterium]
MRRNLVFNCLNQAIGECESLLKNGYTKSGNWSLAQICCHVRLTMERNMNGYPRWMVVLGYPLRPLLRWLALPKLLAGKSPKGIRTAGIFIPADDLDDATEFERFRKCVSKFLDSVEPMHAHPGFGAMSNEEFNHFHAAHAAHHLGFLHPNGVSE